MNKLMNFKWLYFILSLLVMVPGLVIFTVHGLKLGIDFTGGTLLEYRVQGAEGSEQIKKEIENNGISVSAVMDEGNKTYTIKTKPLEENKAVQIKKSLENKFGQVEELRNESVSPTISKEITRNSFIAVLTASVMIVLYLAISFRKVPKPASSWRFGITAVVALLHDVAVLIGVFAILGQYFNVEVDILFVTAVLTVIGFSVHDTIVVFDRIRENLPKYLSKNFTSIANISIAQTLVRSLNTSLTVILVLLALLLFGGESIRWFVVALLVGVISGTYSSIFNATALLCLWEERLGH